MTKYHLLGHGNVALSIILDALNVLYPYKGAEVQIVSNIEKDEKYDHLPYSIEGLDVSEVHHTKWEYEANTKEIKDIKLLFIAAFQPETKVKIYSFFLKNHNVSIVNYTSIIHPKTIIAETARINPMGCFVSPGVVVAPYANICDFVSISRNVSIGHHTEIGGFSTLNPGCNVAGVCKIGKEVIIGMGANIIDGIEIGDNSIIGAGSLVTKSIPENVIAYGVPAKVKGYKRC